MASNLPIQLTTFVGREHELADLRQLVQAVRLLTLVGAGGIGKSRLAVQLARDISAPDGIRLVELASLDDPGLVLQTVAAAFDVREQPGVPLRTTLSETLREREAILVLDNCEHLLSACAELVDLLLRTCIRVRVVATSRQPLGIPGETVWRVPPLGLPPPGSGSDEVGASESVRLLLERARQALPSFALSDRNADAIGQICRQLDGVPLAIELAAARINTLGVDQLLSRLSDRFRLLSAASQHTIDPRHRTLRAAVSWSHDLLTPAEQMLFRRLAVFAGGWTLDAAESICSGPELPRTDLLDLLPSLIDRSLVIAEGQEGAARYGMLETLRQFALEQLDSAGERHALRDRHLDWFLTLAERADTALNGPGQATWLDVFERESQNIRAALAWCLESGAIDTALRLAVACCYFWQIRGHRYRTEGRRWLADAVAAADARSTVDQTALARGLYWLGTFASEQFDFDAATRALERCLGVWQSLGNDRGIAEAQLGLAAVYRDLAQYEQAEALLQQSLERWRELDDRLKVARTQRTIGVLALRRGDGERAHAVLTEAFETLQALGESHLAGHVLDHLGEAEQLHGALDRGLDAHRRGSELLAAAGCEEGVNTSTYLQARIARRRGDRIEALALAARSLEGYRALGNRRDLPACLELVGECIAEDQPARAVRLLGAAAALRRAMRLPLPPASQTSHAAALETARRVLGHAAFQPAFEAGGALTSDAAIELALGFSALAEPGGRSPTSMLTTREIEVVRLVGHGRSNKEIAAELVLSVRTAEGHITHVMNKLGLHSRAQVAVWAVEHGLLTRTEA